MNRPAGGKDDELNQMFFEVPDVLLGRVPNDSLAVFAEEQEAATFDAFALPVDPGVLQCPPVRPRTTL
jgi:hypothetical protein